MQSVMFYVFAAVAIVGSVKVISARNPVHSVLFLVLVFCNVAGLFLLLGAEFLAMVMVIVYVGAVAVLFLFVVMMLETNKSNMRGRLFSYVPVGGSVGIILLIELLLVSTRWIFVPNVPKGSLAEGITNTEALGQVIYTYYVYQFQTAGIALLVAMVGAIMLALRSRSGVRRQIVGHQIARTKANSLEIKKVQKQEGV